MQVRVVCAGVFVASIGLAAPGRLQAVRVCVDSADKAASIGPWSTPKHQVRGCCCCIRQASALLGV
jgi:hypothetical protein